MLNKYLPEIKKISRQVARKVPGISRDDLEQIGCMKLLIVGKVVDTWPMPQTATVVRNAMFDYLRDEYRRNHRIDSDADYFSIADSGLKNPLHILLQKERGEIASKAMAKLSDRQQDIIDKKYIKEMPMWEIGKSIKLTEARISQIHSKSMRILRNLVN